MDMMVCKHHGRASTGTHQSMRKCIIELLSRWLCCCTHIHLMVVCTTSHVVKQLGTTGHESTSCLNCETRCQLRMFEHGHEQFRLLRVKLCSIRDFGNYNTEMRYYISCERTGLNPLPYLHVNIPWLYWECDATAVHIWLYGSPILHTCMRKWNTDALHEIICTCI